MQQGLVLLLDVGLFICEIIYVRCDTTPMYCHRAGEGVRDMCETTGENMGSPVQGMYRGIPRERTESHTHRLHI